MLQRPARAKHCYDCRRCVLKFDHHCQWLSACIGGQNHGWFYACLLVVVAELGLGITLDVLILLSQERTEAEFVFAIVSLGLFVPILVPVSGLALLQTRNFCVGKTTSERFSARRISEETEVPCLKQG